MDLDLECNLALARINARIEKSYQRSLLEVKKIFRGHQRVSMVIRDRDHFYKVVNWCNKNIGKGSQYWTVEGRVLKYIDPTKKAYNPPAKKDWIINVPLIDITPITLM